MAKYAEGTEVTVESSKAEIERLVKKHGGEMVSFGWSSSWVAVLGFRHNGRFLRFEIETPSLEDKEIKYDGRGRARSISAAKNAQNSELRRRWRVLLIRLKLKFEVTADDPALWNQEFMTAIMMPKGNNTVADWLGPQIAEAYELGKMPTQLLLTEGKD